MSERPYSTSVSISRTVDKFLFSIGRDVEAWMSHHPLFKIAVNGARLPPQPFSVAATGPSGLKLR